jgi:anti-anti-sigma factor
MWQQATQDRVQVLTWTASPAQAEFAQAALAELGELVAHQPDRGWVIDAAEISSLSSESIALLIGVVRTINLAGGRMALARPVPSVAMVLRMTRLTKLLPIFDDLPQAVKALG